MLSSNELKELWTDPSFPASFSSAHLFYEELVRAKLEVPSYDEVVHVLQSIPSYQIHAVYRDKRRFRHIENVPGQGIQVIAVIT